MRNHVSKELSYLAYLIITLSDVYNAEEIVKYLPGELRAAGLCVVVGYSANLW